MTGALNGKAHLTAMWTEQYSFERCLLITFLYWGVTGIAHSGKINILKSGQGIARMGQLSWNIIIKPITVASNVRHLFCSYSNRFSETDDCLTLKLVEIMSPN